MRSLGKPWIAEHGTSNIEQRMGKISEDLRRVDESGKTGMLRGMRGGEDEKGCVEAVHRINERWIVHGGLRSNARDYLAHLEAVDLERMHRSCGMAMRVVRERRELEDPKPLFYAGLFSLATEEEAERFLAGHVLTGTVWRLLRGDAAGEGLAGDLAERVREVLRGEK